MRSPKSGQAPAAAVSSSRRLNSGSGTKVSPGTGCAHTSPACRMRSKGSMPISRAAFS
jgi:hypothetical protein